MFPSQHLLYSVLKGGITEGWRTEGKEMPKRQGQLEEVTLQTHPIVKKDTVEIVLCLLYFESRGEKTETSIFINSHLIPFEI